MNEKIIVVGPSGAGKSTFARRLQKILNLPLFALDNIWWDENKNHISREEFDEELYKILSLDKWIIDGDFSRTYEVRMSSADTIYFLDYSLDDCLNGVTNRIGTKREDCPFIETEFDEDFKKWIINWFKDTRPALLELLSKYKNKNIVVFKNRDEANNFLLNLDKNK